jgi:Na+/melibiose symporter-like transporter
LLAGSRESELEAPRAEDAGLRPFRAGLVFGAFNGLTWMIGLGTPMVLFAEALGANALQVGLATSFLYLVLPVQVLATASLARLGYRRQMVMGWWIRALFLLVPLALALAAPERPAPWMANALVASVLGFCILRAFGTAAHLPWMAHILPVSVRGRFFATDNALTSGVGVGTLLLCALLFERFPGWTAFALVYGLALAGSVFAVASLMQLPDAPPPAPVALRTLPRAARRLTFEPGVFRFYLTLTLLGWSASAAIAPFAAYYLKVEGGLSEGRILAYTALQFAGQITASASIRAVIDRVPLRRLFQLGMAVYLAVTLFWLVEVAGGGALRAWIPVAYFGLGVAVGVTAAAHFTMLPELSPAEERPVSMAVFTSILGVAAGLAPILWGLVLKEPGPHPGLHVDRFAAFFAYGAAAHALLLVLYRSLPERRLG